MTRAILGFGRVPRWSEKASRATRVQAAAYGVIIAYVGLIAAEVGVMTAAAVQVVAGAFQILAGICCIAFSIDGQPFSKKQFQDDDATLAAAAPSDPAV